MESKNKEKKIIKLEEGKQCMFDKSLYDLLDEKDKKNTILLKEGELYIFPKKDSLE